MKFYNKIAYNAMIEAQSMGVNIPQSISFIGFDNSDVCNTCPVKLTSVSFDRYSIGVNAANLLFREIDGIHSEGLDIITTMPELVERDSVCSL